MAEKSSTSVEPRWRFDAIAITLLAAGGLLALAVGSSRTVTGSANLFGSWGERAAALLLEPFGWAAVALLAGWFTLTAMLVVNRVPGRLLLRLTGWCVLTLVAAVGADWFG